MTKSSKANRINVKNLKYAVLTANSSSEYTYATINEMAKAMQIQLTPTLATGTLYGDGAKEEDLAKLTGITVQLDSNKLPIEVRADILDNTYENGVLTESKSDEPKEIAMGFEVEQTNGKREVIWLLSGKAQPYANTYAQSTDNITFSTDTITVSFVPRSLDGAIRKFGDTANADFTDTMANSFLSSIPGNTNTVTP